MAQPEVSLTAGHGGVIELTVHNAGDSDCELVVTDPTYRLVGPIHIDVRAGRSTSREWRVSRSLNWYDLEVRMRGDTAFLRRFAGRLETGRDATTDPALGRHR